MPDVGMVVRSTDLPPEPFRDPPRLIVPAFLLMAASFAQQQMKQIHNHTG